MSDRGWSHEQLVLAFWFYCQTPFGQLHQRNPRVIELAALIGRTPSALAMKCCNIASLDPTIRASGRAGLGNASAGDRSIWDEFHADWDGLALEAERLLATLDTGRANPLLHPSTDTDALPDYTGHTRPALVQQRIGQAFFRRSVLSSYGSRCCISGTSEPTLLVASHIVAWSDDPANRLNPSNGLCLSAIHDKAFDTHLFTLSDDLRIVLSERLRVTEDAFLREVFWPTEGREITLPEKFAPDLALISIHRGKTLSPSNPMDS